jgi:hypothetical protein
MLDHHRYARLAREGDRMPWRGRLFGYGTDREGFEVVDLRDGFTLNLIADGSIVVEDPQAAFAPPEPPVPPPHDP